DAGAIGVLQWVLQISLELSVVPSGQRQAPVDEHTVPDGQLHAVPQVPLGPTVPPLGQAHAPDAVHTVPMGQLQVVPQVPLELSVVASAPCRAAWEAHS